MSCMGNKEDAEVRCPWFDYEMRWDSSTQKTAALWRRRIEDSSRVSRQCPSPCFSPNFEFFGETRRWTNFIHMQHPYFLRQRIYSKYTYPKYRLRSHDQKLNNAVNICIHQTSSENQPSLGRTWHTNAQCIW